MKKSTIKLIAMLLTVVLMLPNFAGAGALNENEVDDGLLTWEEVEEIGRLESPATKAYEELLVAWAGEGNEIIYPDAFGGFYLDDDYMLAIKLLNDNETLRSDIISAVSDPSVLKFEDADISFNDLCELNETVFSYVAGSDISYASSGIDVKQGKVVVDAEKAPNNTAAQDSILYTNNSHIIINIVEPTQKKPESVNSFSNSLETVANIAVSTTVNCGGGISYYNSNNTKKGSGALGFYGSYDFIGNGNKIPCFVTAGHVAEYIYYYDMNVVGNDTTILSSANTNATHVKYVYGNEGFGTSYSKSNGDYAFIRYSNLDATNRLDTVSNYKLTYYDDRDSVLPGKTVFKVGPKTGLTSGKVSEPGKALICELANGNKIEVSGLYEVTPTSTSVGFGDNGDSGAPVFYANSAGSYTLVGVFHGQAHSGDRPYLFTPMSTVCGNGKFTPSMPKYN